MNTTERFRAWSQRPEVKPWLAACLWWLVVMNVVWAHRDFRGGYDARAKTQAARMSCESEGGFYGSPVGAREAVDRCFKPALETARLDPRTR